MRVTAGIDEFLSWRPADLVQAAVWLRMKRNDIQMSITGLNNAARDGTTGQCGSYIDERRAEADELGSRMDELARILDGAANTLDTAGELLLSLIGSVKAVCAEIDDGGFIRSDGCTVLDARSEIEIGADKVDREIWARELSQRLRELRDQISDCDSAANQALHSVVDRPVRDRTPEGNGNPFVTGLSSTTVITASASAAAELVDGNWRAAAAEAGRGIVAARSFGTALAGIGCVGGVASRPEDEPLMEAIVAEGVGALAGTIALPIGAAFGAPLGPLGAFMGGTAIGGATAQWTASAVREGFDRAN